MEKSNELSQMLHLPSKAQSFFVEVDNKQTMVNNYKKIDFYAEAFQVIENRTGNEPMLIFYTNSEIRKEKILAYATDKGITTGVFTKRDLQ